MDTTIHRIVVGIAIYLQTVITIIAKREENLWLSKIF